MKMCTTKKRKRNICTFINVHEYIYMYAMYIKRKQADLIHLYATFNKKYT